MDKLRGHWDHSTKPSKFCVKRGNEEIYRGGYSEGYELLMNNIKTPATDDLARGNHVVPTEWAQQLERERDEAREELKHIAEYGTEEINAAVDLRQKLASALIERDEAREALEYIAHAGLSARHIEDYAKDFLRRKEDGKMKIELIKGDTNPVAAFFSTPSATPETDAEHAQFAMGGFTLDFCRKLERERDEAREEIKELREIIKIKDQIAIAYQARAVKAEERTK